MKIRARFAALLCVLLCTSLVSTAFAVETRDFGFETGLATRLETLELFLGVGEKEDGSTDFALDRAPNRAEALTMLVRAMGKESESNAMTGRHPFSDVPAWADGIVSYAYMNGLTKGVSNDNFGTNDTASAEMYLTFMLRALGYSDASGGDFTWDAPWALAETCGLLPPQVDRDTFLRADVVDITCAALYANLKGSQTKLHESLAKSGVFTTEAFSAAFPQNPFATTESPNGQPSYDQALAQTVSAVSTVTQRLEAPSCTVVEGALNTPRGSAITLTMVYKPGSTLGAGKTVQLPLPQVNYIGTQAKPENLTLSGDGLTLTYTCHFDTREVGNAGQADEFVIHEAGTYEYTVDLTTGEAQLNIRPD